jgi:quercetin dioxygenase-like cupin family protein
MPNLEENLIAQGYSLHTWSNAPGFSYPVHEHPYHKIIVVQKGSITFYLPAEKREVVLEIGQTLELEPPTAHSATVGPNGVTCLEEEKQ